MHTMANDQLTRELSLLANRVQGLVDKLEEFMQEILDKVLEGKKTNGIASKMRECMSPLSQAYSISRSKTLDDNTELLNGMIATVNVNLSEHNTIRDEMNNKFGEFEPVKTVVTKLDMNVGLLQTEAHRVANGSTST